MRASTVGFLGLIVAAGVGCGSHDADGRGKPADDATVKSVFAIPDALSALGEETFFDQPWPSDLRREEDGTVRFEGYPNPRQVPLIVNYVDSMKGVSRGFSPAAAGLARFTGPLDPASLPASPVEALGAASSVQLIDIDPASPEHGERKLVSLEFHAEAGVYWPENALAFMPSFGTPLRPGTRYALVVTDAVRAADGGRVGACDEVKQLLGLERAEGAAAGAASALEDVPGELRAAGVDPENTVQITVFTTDDPTRDTIAIRDWVMQHEPAPDVLPGTWTATTQTSAYDVYEGSYGPSPNFQRGNIPFQKYGDGGELAFTADGEPEKQNDFELRFALTVPSATACSMPASGYPIALYAHGTGGNYRSYINDGSAEGAARACIAMMGIDQIFHGTRPGGPCSLVAPPCNTNLDLIFFNVENPTAARANGPESAIDVVQQARLFTETGITIPPAISRTGTEIRFDGQKLLFMGHSQGGLNGPIFLGVDDQARGGILSGSGSMISISILEKTKPVNVAGLVKMLMGLTALADQAEVDPLHPIISLIQTIVDPTDPIHYAPLIIQRPRAGFAPKSIYQTEGVEADGSGDNYTPPHSIEVESVALGLPVEEPVIHPVVEAAWSGLAPVTIGSSGLSGNLAGGRASGVLAQWHAEQASDGHFVIFDIPDAMSQAMGFMRNLADDPVGRVPAR